VRVLPEERDRLFGYGLDGPVRIVIAVEPGNEDANFIMALSIRIHADKKMEKSSMSGRSFVAVSLYARMAIVAAVGSTSENRRRCRLGLACGAVFRLAIGGRCVWFAACLFGGCRGGRIAWAVVVRLPVHPASWTGLGLIGPG